VPYHKDYKGSGGQVKQAATLKMKVTYFSKTSVAFQQTAQHYIPEDKFFRITAIGTNIPQTSWKIPDLNKLRTFRWQTDEFILQY
jgi:hypothetical protein